MARTYVALDLETTGLSSERDAIIEIGAVRFQQDQIEDTFSTLVNPGRPIPTPIIELTGITDADVREAPSIHEVLDRLVRFVGQRTVIGHSVGFDLAFLGRHNRLTGNRSLDTFELASVLLPNAERYSLESLALMQGIELERAHRALDDARATFGLFRSLLDRAASLPARTLKEIIGQGQRAGWPAADFFREALEEAARAPAERRPAPPQPGPAGPLFDTRARPRSPESVPEPSPIDVDQLATLLEEDGAFASHFPHFEHRPQQVEMLRAIGQAFNRREHLLAEAPTGVGKSLAYLIPAVHWAVNNDQRVVISTNTINLQEQLYRKDLPDLTSVLPFEFRASVLKGRSHYLCPARLRALRRRGANSPTMARVLAKILVWLTETTDGDGDELFLPSPEEQTIWRQLSAENEGCDPEHCRVFHSNGCYFYQARRAAEAAHLIIVNHALLLADVAVQNRALPEYKYLIIDEAHHLESATTNGLSFEITHNQMRRLMREVGQVAQSGRVTGLLSEVLSRTEKAKLPPQIAEKLELGVGKVGLAVNRAMGQIDDFFSRLHGFVTEHQTGHQNRYALRLRINSGLRVQPAWENIEIAWDDAHVPLSAVIGGLEKLAGGLDELAAFDVVDLEDLQAHVIGVARRLAEVADNVGQLISQPSSSLIYWLSLNPAREQLSLHAAPLHVGPLVEEHLFNKKWSVILTSATLRTAGSFDFLRERLHAWEAEELAVGSPFDYQNSTLVYLVNDIPEPGKPGYQRAVAQGMGALFKATGGRALALFTSYSQLRATLRVIKAPLAQAGITTQAQGEGISRAQLLENFRTGERRVLLGTRSFWEGIDVPGDPLSCLAIAKLPFSVPSDPIFAARAETFEHHFMEYAVPETILRFLQGFGRLIRTRTDRGVVAIFDRRLLTKSYGQLFLDSLPDPTIQTGSVTLLPKTAAEWLDSA